MDFKQIATKSVDFPEPYIANISFGQGAGHPPMEVDYPFVLLHEVLYHLITKQGMAVKHAKCLEASVDQRLGDMTPQFCKQCNRDPDTCMRIGFHGDGVPFTMSLNICHC